MKRPIVFVIVTLVLVYTYLAYYRYPMESGLIQTEVEAFTWNMLFSKQPIVVHTPVADPETVLRAWFGRKQLHAKPLDVGDWIRNSNKYRIIYNGHATEAYEILLAPPYKKPDPANGDSVTALRIPPFTMVIVPFHWYLAGAPSDTIWSYDYNDWITWLLP